MFDFFELLKLLNAGFFIEHETFELLRLLDIFVAIIVKVSSTAFIRSFDA